MRGDSSSTPNSRSASNQALITNFTIVGQAVQAIIDDEGNTVMANMSLGSELNRLSPSITVSERASISPASGVAQDFNNPIEYTVTAEDGTIKAYIVTVDIFPAITYSPYDESRLGAGDLYKEDLFNVSNIEDGDYEYTITLGSYTKTDRTTATENTFNISLVAPNNADSVPDQVRAGDDGEVFLIVSIDGEEYFNQRINKEQYNLRTANDVQGMQHDLAGAYTLMNDVDMTGIDFMPIGYDTTPNHGGYDGIEFSGSINGNGNEISNLTITFDNSYIGFISNTTGNAELNNIALIDINIDNDGSGVGGLVGVNNGTITNSYATGAVTADGQFSANTGGLVGNLRDNGSITNSYWNIGSSGQNMSDGEDSTSNYTGVENAGSIINNNEIYQANLKTGGGDTPTYTVGNVFVGWDFDNVWEFRAGQFPILRGVGGGQE